MKTLRELAYYGARVRIKQLNDEIKELKSLLKNGKTEFKAKIKQQMTPARRKALLKNLEKARAARYAKFNKR